jgi:hypothetical protein
MTPHERAPQLDEVMQSLREIWRAGISLNIEVLEADIVDIFYNDGKPWPKTSDQADSMTLIVAGIGAGAAWMVSDTLISGGDISLRDRHYQIKCIPSDDTKALIGFAGDTHHGNRLMEQAAKLPGGEEVVRMLADAQRKHASVDFLYAFLDQKLPRLFRISGGAAAADVLTAYIGEKEAFEDFQAIRHAAEIDPVPRATEFFFFGTRAPCPIPQDVSRATLSMLRLFMQGRERAVGGWAVPYVLGAQGAFMCGYGYSVSDPILDQIAPGSVVPHGTAEAGGYGLSVTELGERAGMTVYWRQLPGGLVLTRQDTGYQNLRLEVLHPNSKAERLRSSASPSRFSSVINLTGIRKASPSYATRMVSQRWQLP